MNKKLEQITLEEGKAYDCEIVTLYGHEEFSGKVLYLGRNMGHKHQLHGFAYKKDKRLGMEETIVIKLPDSKLMVRENGILEIDGFNRVYSLNEDEERRISSILNVKGL